MRFSTYNSVPQSLRLLVGFTEHRRDTSCLQNAIGRCRKQARVHMSTPQPHAFFPTCLDSPCLLRSLNRTRAGCTLKTKDPPTKQLTSRDCVRPSRFTGAVPAKTRPYVHSCLKNREFHSPRPSIASKRHLPARRLLRLTVIPHYQT